MHNILITYQGYEHKSFATLEDNFNLYELEFYFNNGTDVGRTTFRPVIPHRLSNLCKMMRVYAIPLFACWRVCSCPHGTAVEGGRGSGIYACPPFERRSVYESILGGLASEKQPHYWAGVIRCAGGKSYSYAQEAAGDRLCGKNLRKFWRHGIASSAVKLYF